MVGARVLVVGAGDIGRTIGRMLAGFDVQLTYVARTAREGVRSTDDLPQLLPHADVVIVIVPVTPQTTRLVDAAFLAAMADDTLLVNAARGVVVDTDALLAELRSGRLRAALDVTEPEPLPEGHPLRTHPRAIITPHMAFHSVEATEELQRRAATEVLRVLTGERPDRPVNPEVLA
jgi:phosphoglycerate dehydrogenase-like enzyme